MTPVAGDNTTALSSVLGSTDAVLTGEVVVSIYNEEEAEAGEEIGEGTTTGYVICCCWSGSAAGDMRVTELLLILTSVMSSEAATETMVLESSE